MTTETQTDTPPTTGSSLPSLPVKLRSLADIITDLKKKIPDKYLETRNQSGKELTYFSWDVAVKALDAYAPGWSSEIRQVIHSEGHIGVVMRLYIPCAEFGFPGVFREDMGGDYENADVAKRAKGFDPFLDAKQQALKRAAAQFGFGLYLYAG